MVLRPLWRKPSACSGDFSRQFAPPQSFRARHTAPSRLRLRNGWGLKRDGAVVFARIIARRQRWQALDSALRSSYVRYGTNGTGDPSNGNTPGISLRALRFDGIGASVTFAAGHRSDETLATVRAANRRVSVGR
jgi:hypothetical protein